jgi:hypothetical protein
MFSSLLDLQKERGFPHPSRKKKLLKLKRESTCCRTPYPRQSTLDRVMIRCGEGAMDAELGPLIEKATVPLKAAGAREVYVCRRPLLQGKLLR